ncbi:MAG: amidohydrolase [Nitriliruptor sp.]|uniref:amidohydrolase n=1 Tax=Nitriliruptor sp. TaxID=2448056 RepID=UPI0034A040A5
MTADLLVVLDDPAHGSIWTGTGRPTDAVAVADGRIVALGFEARERRGPRTEVVEVSDGSLLPAFRDGHAHPLNGGAESLDCDLVDSPDVDEVLRRLAAFVAADGAGGGATSGVDAWVLGWGYPPEVLPGGVGRASTLDAVVGDRPVALWSSDHHMVWCNSRALAVAGITAATDDPPRGTIVRDADGTPVGTLLEEAEHLLEAHIPPRGIDKEARGLRVGLDRMTSAGIVWAQDAWITLPLLPAFSRVADAGDLTVDLDLAPKVEVDGWRDQVEAFVEARREVADATVRRTANGVPGGRLSLTTVKLFVDGVIEGGTGALLEPYCALAHDAGSGGGHGIANWEPGELAEACAAFDAAGFQLHLHAIGDRAVRDALDAFGHVAEVNGDRDRRPVTAHTHLVHPDDRARFRSLGAVANFEPLWAQPNEIMVDLTEPRLGAERAGWQYPIGSLLRSGAHVSFGSDWPVSSLVPLEGIGVAVTRRVPGETDGQVLHPSERITRDEALGAYTAGVAYQAGDEHEAGIIAVGSRADLVLTGADVTRVPDDVLGQIPVRRTWRSGSTVSGD